jgi:hypothetical protein
MSMSHGVAGQHGNYDAALEEVSELIRRLNAERLKLCIALRLTMTVRPPAARLAAMALPI